MARIIADATFERENEASSYRYERLSLSTFTNNDFCIQKDALDEIRVVRPKRKNTDLTPFDLSWQKVECQAMKKANQFRIRGGIPEMPNEDTKGRVMIFFHKVFGYDFDLHIRSCHRVQSWMGPEYEKDILVYFTDHVIRDMVFKRSKLIQKAYRKTVICDELCDERVRIWKEAYEQFGYRNVYVYKSNVYIRHLDHIYEIVSIMHFHKFLRECMMILDDIPENQLLYCGSASCGEASVNSRPGTFCSNIKSMRIPGTSYRIPGLFNRKEETCQEENANMVIKRRNDDLKPFEHSIIITEYETMENSKKFRIRGLAETPNEDTILRVFNILSFCLPGYIKRSYIAKAHRVVSWNGLNYEDDIVVQFGNRIIRDFVFRHRKRIRNFYEGKVIICDELCSERVRIWIEAMRKFGSRRVFIYKAAICIRYYDRIFQILSYAHYQLFLKKFVGNLKDNDINYDEKADMFQVVRISSNPQENLNEPIIEEGKSQNIEMPICHQLPEPLMTEEHKILRTLHNTRSLHERQE